MLDSVRKNNHRACVWGGFGFAFLTLVGLLFVAGYVPPPTPSLSASEVSILYNDHVLRIRIGMIVLMFGSALYIPFTALTALLIRNIEGHFGVISITQILGGFTNTMLFFYPPLWWLTAAFRLDRAPELIELAHDAAWLQYMGGIAPILFLPGSIAWAAFIDKSKNPVFPRWFGYLNVWMIAGLLPGQLLFFFKSGPFAWDGLFGFWIPALVFFVWMFTLVFVVGRAVEKGRSLTDE